jgi:hypothetical protein
MIDERLRDRANTASPGRRARRARLELARGPRRPETRRPTRSAGNAIEGSFLHPKEQAMADVHRLLVLAGAALADLEELPPSVRALIDAADEVFVLTPTLTSRMQWLVSDIDRAHEAADERLDAVLGQLRSVDVSAHGAVGDDSPLDAVADRVRSFSPDHILIALRSAEHGGWQERGLTERIQQLTHLPLTIFEIDPAGRVTERSTTEP